MDRKLIFGGVLGLSVLGGIAVLAQEEGTNPAPDLTVAGMPVTMAMLATGQEVYEESCASCHGTKLEGQPDWQRRLDNGRMPAPPHDDSGHSWHHSDGNLLSIIRGGVGAVVPGYESDMPAFETTLSEDEMTAVLAYIKSSWSARETEFQAEVTAADMAAEGAN